MFAPASSRLHQLLKLADIITGVQDTQLLSGAHAGGCIGSFSTGVDDDSMSICRAHTGRLAALLGPALPGNASIGT